MVSKSTSATLNARRELGKVTFRKDFWDCYLDQGKQWAKGPVIIYRLGGGGDKRGDQSKLRTQKGRSLKTLEGFRGGTTQIWLENEDMVGGSRKSSNFIRGHHFSEVHSKGGSAKFHLVFAPPPLPQTINNDRSLIAK